VFLLLNGRHRYFPVFVLHIYVEKENCLLNNHGLHSAGVEKKTKTKKKRKQRLKRKNDVERVGKRRRKRNK